MAVLNDLSILYQTILLGPKAEASSHILYNIPYLGGVDIFLIYLPHSPKRSAPSLFSMQLFFGMRFRLCIGKSANIA